MWNFFYFFLNNQIDHFVQSEISKELENSDGNSKRSSEAASSTTASSSVGMTEKQLKTAAVLSSAKVDAPSSCTPFT